MLMLEKGGQGVGTFLYLYVSLIVHYHDDLNVTSISNNPTYYSTLPMHPPSNSPDTAGCLHLHPS